MKMFVEFVIFIHGKRNFLCPTQLTLVDCLQSSGMEAQPLSSEVTAALWLLMKLQKRNIHISDLWEATTVFEAEMGQAAGNIQKMGSTLDRSPVCLSVHTDRHTQTDHHSL
ncbi:hypothetical protein EXN66_Car014089 [Channa argus]|uniref:Uncharacterized protein n=1 Tax=Channa argus TaxID=215402 RepID=A0A6G1Q810_CHAAH|nr:hypothetical protein EXN66_Car014089 [Channa argus]